VPLGRQGLGAGCAAGQNLVSYDRFEVIALLRHAVEQYLTLAQLFAQAFRQTIGRAQTTHNLLGSDSLLPLKPLERFTINKVHAGLQPLRSTKVILGIVQLARPEGTGAKADRANNWFVRTQDSAALGDQ
jgi:hypothetical protein